MQPVIAFGSTNIHKLQEMEPFFWQPRFLQYFANENEEAASLLIMTSTPIILSTRSRGPVEQFSRFEFDSDV
jgi:hypothetical protein